MQILESMVRQFNNIMEQEGTVIRLKFIKDEQSNKCEVHSVNMKYIDSCVLKTTPKFKAKLAKFFNYYNLDLCSNAAGDTFWAKNENPTPQKEVPLKNGDDKINPSWLSVRAYNVLQRGGVRTINDLLNTTQTKLLKMRGMGASTVAEIVKKVNELGGNISK